MSPPSEAAIRALAASFAPSLQGDTAQPRASTATSAGCPHLFGSDYVAGAFLFPTSVKGNPYETVRLLATHVAEQVADRV